MTTYFGAAAKPLSDDVDMIPHEKRLTTFFNKKLVHEKTALDVFRNHKKIHDHVVNGKFTDATKSGYLGTLLIYLKIAKAPKKLIDLYSDLSTEYMVKHKDDKDDNKRAKNKYSLDDLKRVLSSLYADFKREPNHSNVNRLLSIALNVMRPPIRTEYSDMRFVKRLPGYVKNYIVPRPNGRYEIVLRKFKTKRSHGEYRSLLPKDLCDIITETLDVWNRKYLMANPNDGSKPLKYDAYNRVLNSVLSQGYGQNELRSIYISSFLSNKKNTNAQKKQLAKDMMTSTEMMYADYTNVGLDDDIVMDVVPTEEGEEPFDIIADIFEASKQKPKPRRLTQQKPSPPIPEPYYVFKAKKEHERLRKAVPKEPLPPIPVKEVKTLPKRQNPEYQHQKYLERRQQGKTSNPVYGKDPTAYKRRDAINRVVRGLYVRQSTLDQYGITQAEIDDKIAQR